MKDSATQAPNNFYVFKDVQPDFKDFVNESVRIITSRDNGKDKTITWSFEKTTSSVEMYRGVAEGSSWNCLKGKIVVNAKANDVADCLNNPKKMPLFDDMISSCSVISELTPDGRTSIRYVQAKAVFPTTARDFLVLTSEETLEDGTIIISSRSIGHEEIPERSDFVRANTIISGYIIRPLSRDQCELTLICHMDLGGYIPSSVINFVGGSAPVKLLTNVKRICEENSDTSSESSM